MADEQDLFNNSLESALSEARNLAARLRPETLDEFAGQRHILEPGKPLRAIIDKGLLTSLVFWGTPGTGKTTLARIIAKQANALFEEYSAVTSTVSDIRKVVEAARKRLAASGRKTIIFVDEFHRFNKAQQDAFLPHLESGLLTLIGATTENPYFALNPALRSRTSIFHFDRLDHDSCHMLLARAMAKAKEHDDSFPEEISAEGAEELVLLSNGDARVLLNLLEVSAATLAPGAKLTPEHIREAACERNLDYGRMGTDRFDMVSAMIKSMRGSNPDAALYWMTRLLEGGEAPEFVARRLIIFAAEDIGCASPQAINVAAATIDAVTYTGMPEAQIPLASCCVFLATCPKSNAAYKALKFAKHDVQTKALGPVPLHLRNYDFTKEKQKGRDSYKYPHDFPGHWVEQNYFPPGMEGTVYYRPSGQGHELRIAERLSRWRANREGGSAGGENNSSGKRRETGEEQP